MKSKSLTLISLLVVAAMLLPAACGPTPTPQVIKETVVVEKEVQSGGHQGRRGGEESGSAGGSDGHTRGSGAKPLPAR